MSRRFNKTSAEDFGLQETDENMAVNPADGTIWARTELYDFGWGRENGYYKCPMPEFIQLFNILLTGDEKEDMYGAAAMILDRYPDELAAECEKLIKTQISKEQADRLYRLLRMNTPVNIFNVLNKPYSEVKADFDRWKEICAEIAALTH